MVIMSFICRFCGREFNNKSALTQHERHYCKLNPDRQEVRAYINHKKVACSICGRLIDVANIKRHEASCGKRKLPNYRVTHEGLNCIFCGKLCKNKNSLAQHELRCKENPERRNYNSLELYNLSEKGATKETSIRVAKAAETLKQKYATGERVVYALGKPGTFTGRKHTEESKAKTRASTLAYIEKMYGSISTRYNVNACRYIDFLNSKFGWNLQHAESGGEFRVCNYFLDGYDKELNIAFEYDEPRHYANVKENLLCERDINRMRSIQKELSCRFIRYNEQIGLLYEIDNELTWHQL